LEKATVKYSQQQYIDELNSSSNQRSMSFETQREAPRVLRRLDSLKGWSYERATTAGETPSGVT